LIIAQQKILHKKDSFILGGFLSEKMRKNYKAPTETPVGGLAL